MTTKGDTVLRQPVPTKKNTDQEDASPKWSISNKILDSGKIKNKKKKKSIENFQNQFKQFQEEEVLKFQKQSGLDWNIIQYGMSQCNSAFDSFYQNLEKRKIPWIDFAALWSFYSLSVLKCVIHPPRNANSKLLSDNTRLCEKTIFGDEGLKVRKKWMALTDFYLNEKIPDSTVIQILKDKASETFLSEADSLSDSSLQPNIASIFVSRFALLYLAKGKLNNELKFSEVYTRYVNYAKPLRVEIVPDRTFTAYLSMAVLFLFQGNLIRHRTEKGIFFKGVVWKTNAE